MSTESEKSTIKIPTAISSSSVVDDLKNLNNQIRAKIVSDSIKKGAIGAISGAAFSFLIFRRNQIYH